MTDQEMNVAIAEAVGWRFEPHVDVALKTTANNCWIPPFGADWHTQPLPDFTRDLNAMHEAAMWLKQNDEHAYQCCCSLVFETVLYFIDATARQRAEAFLRTVGRWTE